jgi:hypothetical protein
MHVTKIGYACMQRKRLYRADFQYMCRKAHYLYCILGCIAGHINAAWAPGKDPPNTLDHTIGRVRVTAHRAPGVGPSESKSVLIIRRKSLYSQKY